MKKFKTFIVACLLFCTMFTFTGCKKDPPPASPPNTLIQFGEFGYNGIYLTSYASSAITPVQAKEILSSNISNIQPASVSALSSDPEPDLTLVNHILSKYSGCEILTRYYEEGSSDSLTKVDALQGTDFRTMLTTNQHIPFSQLIAKYVLAFPTLIDAMETRNNEYHASEESLIAPFTNIFSYHTNSKGELVIHTRDFAEIPSSVGGGIGCSYRQDTEILYDADNKMQKWQTSLGLYSATPQGTMKQGYILEVEFNWIQKV